MSNIIDNSNCVANFPHKLLTTNRQVSNFCKTFANDLSANRKAAADTDFEKKVLELAAAKLEIWNEQIEDIMKIAKSLEGSHLLIKDVN